MEEGWESYASEAGNSGMGAGALSSNEVFPFTDTDWDHNADVEKTDLTKKTSKKERQWIRIQKFINKQSD